MRNPRPAARLSKTISIPPPIGGWNARDAYAAMAPTDAVTLQNYWPTTTDVMFRKGYSRFAYGFGDPIETLMWYSSGTSDKFFAIENGEVFDITAGGDFSAAIPEVTGLTSSRWQHLNVATAAGAYLLMVNGQDKLQGFDGSNWYEDGDGAHDITGFDTATATNINIHKSRVWFTESGTLKAWYLATNAIAGAATSFDLSGIARKGGSLTAMATWTIDAGYGVDDHAAFITSNGEVILYRGTDPASLATWGLVGVYELGAPIGRRCSLKFGGDLLFITQDGIVPMAQGLQSSRLDPRVNLTDKIQQAVSNAATLYSGNFGWQMLYYAKANMLIMNIPIQEGQNQEQYAMNTISKSWCNFVNVQASCWSLYNDEPFFGADGFVGKFWDGFADYPAATAQNINVIGLQAFNNFGSPFVKMAKMLQPIISTDGSPAISANVNVDFDLSDTTGSVSFTPSATSVWDTALWDSSLWGGGAQIQKYWQGANQIGQYLAVQLRGASSLIETHWMATNVVYGEGGTL